MHNKLVKLVQDTYQTREFIPLHAPTFDGNEKKYDAKPDYENLKIFLHQFL